MYSSGKWSELEKSRGLHLHPLRQAGSEMRKGKLHGPSQQYLAARHKVSGTPDLELLALREQLLTCPVSQTPPIIQPHSIPLISTTMALRAAPSAGFLQSFLAVAQASLRPTAGPSRSLLQTPVLGQWRSALLPAIVIPIPSLVSDIWESVLRAVPKKKTSHMKKRHRQMAGKALKDVTALNTCSACGRTKRAHVLCPHCVQSRFKSPGSPGPC